MYLIEYNYVCDVNIKKTTVYERKLPCICDTSIFYFCIY